MPNVIDAGGLTTQTIAEIIAEILNGTTDYAGMYAIYGADINVDPNSPDGQMVNIIAQAKADLLEFLTQIFNSFDPDQAIGVALNARCAINGVVRNPGTHTIQQLVVTCSGIVTLPGLDTAPLAPFTVQDAQGNQYQLISTFTTAGPGDNFLDFQAALLGPVTSALTTINSIVTITAGVTAVTNALAPTSIGLTEETDFALRIRRAKSVSLPSKGYLEGLVGALIDTPDVIDAAGYENNGSAPDSHGIPGHSIWCIVDGGSDDAVAKAIYVKRNAGCGMKGGVSVNVLQVDGSYMVIDFDRPTGETLYIKFDVAAIGSGSVDPVYIRQQLLLQLIYTINQPADTTSIVSLIKLIAPNASVSGEGVSRDGITYLPLISNFTVDRLWQLAAARIIINGIPG